MKKIILNILVATMVLGPVAVAYAETEGGVGEGKREASTTKPLPGLIQARMDAQEQIKNLKQETKDEVENLRDKVASTTAEIRDRLKEEVKNRAENRFTKMLSRYQATIDREEAIMTRINSRIAKITSNGGNTTEAEGLVLKAKSELDLASTSLASLKTLVGTETALEISSTTAKTTRTALENMKKAGAEIDKHLRTAHQALQKTIGSLRGVSQLHNATSTKENN